MERKVDWEEVEQSERGDYSDEESDEEEPRIKDFLDILSLTVARKRASELLHSRHFQRYFVLDTLWAITPTSAHNPCDKRLRAGRMCVAPA